jgi:MinD superfamily P-loop ATPase
MNDFVNEIVILSGKGGTGKTSLSASLATLGDKKIVADCDVDASNLYLILQPETSYQENFLTGFKAVIDENRCTNCGKCISYCRFEAISLVNGKVHVTETSCDGCKLCTHVCPVEAITMNRSQKSKWFIGPFRNGTMISARLAPGEDNSGKLVTMVRNLAKDEACYADNHTIIIDGPPGIGCPAISSVTGSQLAVIVTEPTRSGLHDLKRILALISNFEVHNCVVINKYDLNESISNDIDVYCRNLQIPVIGRIPFDPNIVMAMVHCKSVVEWAPDSPASKEIVSIYHLLMESARGLQ